MIDPSLAPRIKRLRHDSLQCL